MRLCECRRLAALGVTLRQAGTDQQATRITPLQEEAAHDERDKVTRFWQNQQRGERRTRSQKAGPRPVCM